MKKQKQRESELTYDSFVKEAIEKEINDLRIVLTNYKVEKSDIESIIESYKNKENKDIKLVNSDGESLSVELDRKTEVFYYGEVEIISLSVTTDHSPSESLKKVYRIGGGSIDDPEPLLVEKSEINRDDKKTTCKSTYPVKRKEKYVENDLENGTKISIENDLEKKAITKTETNSKGDIKTTIKYENGNYHETLKLSDGRKIETIFDSNKNKTKKITIEKNGDQNTEIQFENGDNYYHSKIITENGSKEVSKYIEAENGTVTEMEIIRDGDEITDKSVVTTFENGDRIEDKYDKINEVDWIHVPKYGNNPTLAKVFKSEFKRTFYSEEGGLDGNLVKTYSEEDGQTSPDSLTYIKRDRGYHGRRESEISADFVKTKTLNPFRFGERAAKKATEKADEMELRLRDLKTYEAKLSSKSNLDSFMESLSGKKLDKGKTRKKCVNQ